MPQEFVRIRWLANLKDDKKKSANIIHFKIVYVFFLCIFAAYIFWVIIIFQYIYDIEPFNIVTFICKNMHFDKIIVCVADKEKLLTMLDHWVSLVGL